jgi:hypothetical protein
MVERLSREKIRKGVMLHGGPCPSDPIPKDPKPSTRILAEIEAIDAEYEARFKRDLAVRLELERLQRQAKRRRR